jgi:hypothetical protein
VVPAASASWPDVSTVTPSMFGSGSSIIGWEKLPPGCCIASGVPARAAKISWIVFERKHAIVADPMISASCENRVASAGSERS